MIDLRSIAICLDGQGLPEEVGTKINCFMGSEKQDFQRRRM